MCLYYAGVYLFLVCCDLLLCDCVWVCVYVGGVVDVVECVFFFLESRCVWVDCQFV